MNELWQLLVIVISLMTAAAVISVSVVRAVLKAQEAHHGVLLKAAEERWQAQLKSNQELFQALLKGAEEHWNAHLEEVTHRLDAARAANERMNDRLDTLQHELSTEHVHRNDWIRTWGVIDERLEHLADWLASLAQPPYRRSYDNNIGNNASD